MEKNLKDLDLFQLLDLKHKLIFAKSLADELNTALKAQDHEYAALVCEKNGHKFSKPKEVIKIVKDENPYFTPYNGTKFSRKKMYKMWINWNCRNGF